MAISAETQCSRSRVAGPMSCSRPPASPAQMPIDSSMTLPAAKPATASARSSARSVLVLRRGERGGVERHQPIAERSISTDQRCRRAPAAPRQTSRSRRVVMLTRPSQHVRLARQHRLRSARRRRRIAGRRPRGSARACRRRVCDDERERSRRSSGFGARCAQRRVEDALRVVAAEAKRLDGLVGGGAAGAAEAASGGAGRPQWRQCTRRPLPDPPPLRGRAGDDLAQRGRVGMVSSMHDDPPRRRHRRDRRASRQCQVPLAGAVSAASAT